MLTAEFSEMGNTFVCVLQLVRIQVTRCGLLWFENLVTGEKSKNEKLKHSETIIGYKAIRNLILPARIRNVPDPKPERPLRYHRPWPY